ncbi:MAG: GtrA family protein [Acidobacteriaceae bacterium]|jgi:putative flippase GtrA|nr:GtrA family protein [Acidobacteriaceae bacterium]
MTRRPLAFLTVGAGGFLVQLFVLTALTRRHWPIAATTALAVEAAVLVNFFWHERWTWRDRRGSRGPRLLQFHVTSGFLSVAGNVAVTLALTRIGVPLLVANAVAVAAMSALNYAAADRWVFRHADHPRAGRRGSLGSRLPLACGLAVLVATTSDAAEPGAATIAAWQRHIGGIEVALPQHEADPPLDLPMGRSVDVPGGTIYEWRGSVRLRNTSVAQVVDALTTPGTPPPQEDVIAARVLSKDGLTLRVFLRLVRQTIVTVTYDTEHDVRFTIRAPDFATSRSISTSIVEHDGGNRGFLWRLNSYWRYRQTGRDVQVDVLSVSLSREIPFVLKPMAGPIANRIARESLVRTLNALRDFMAQQTVEQDH